MCRIIIADDDKKFAQNCSSYLTKEKNIEIIDTVYDGRTALESYIENKPDVLILDLQMPNMTGIEVLNRLSNIEEEKKKNNVIIISRAIKKLQPYNTVKVYRIIPKSNKGEVNFDDVAQTIFDIKEVIDDKYLEKTIDDLFFKLRLHFLSRKSISYLKQVVFYCFKYDEFYDNISLAYEKIANNIKDKNIKAKNILWSLESLIDTYEKSIDKAFLHSSFIYYDDTRNLTPKYLVELIVIHLKQIIR